MEYTPAAHFKWSGSIHNDIGKMCSVGSHNRSARQSAQRWEGDNHHLNNIK